MDNVKNRSRTGASYMLGWVDALAWAITHRTTLDQLAFDIFAADGGATWGLCNKAADIFEAAGDDPAVWAEGSHIDDIFSVEVSFDD